MKHALRNRRILCILAMLLVLFSGVSYVEVAEKDAFRVPCGRTADASVKREELVCIPVISFSSSATGAEQRRIQKGNRKNQRVFSAVCMDPLFETLSAGMHLYVPEGVVTGDICVVHTHRIMTDFIHKSDGKKRV